ncbi:MAG TPA: hypothetical protein VL172_13840, partial [Kofleriaceae bacterium]|nr:hypothetical protein [Kofleriaceae bacterium]
CASLVALTPARALASPWPEPERPTNQPFLLDVGAIAYLGSGYDGGFDGDGTGVRVTALVGNNRPLWLLGRGTLHLPLTDGDPSLLQWDLQFGRSLWTCDCALLDGGQLRAQVPRRGPDGAVREYQARPLQGEPRTVRFATDVVAVAGLRMWTWIGDHPDGYHQGTVFLPQAGLWYQQQHLLAGRPGHLRVSLLGSYEYRDHAVGVFAALEASRGRIFVGVDAGGLAGDHGGRELSFTAGCEL